MKKLMLFDDLPDVLKATILTGCATLNISKDNVTINECESYAEFKDLMHYKNIEMEMLTNKDTTGSIISVILIGILFAFDAAAQDVNDITFYFKELASEEFENFKDKFEEYKKTNDLRKIL